MNLSELDYALPRDLIAQEPAARREASRLLVLDRASGGVTHRGFDDLPGLLRAGDCLVLNESRVIPARLRLVKEGTGGGVEALLLRDLGGGRWETFLNPAGRVRAGLRLAHVSDRVRAIAVIEGREPSGRWTIRELDPVPGGLPATMGEMPLPPYIRRDGTDGQARLRALDVERYQTVYARVPGSVAAPTAGLHLTEAILRELASAGIETVRVLLHVGPGTFRPVTAERLEDHVMDGETFEVGESERGALCAALRGGRRIVAVGTTSVRVLETLGPEGLAGDGPARGETAIFIRPGYAFRVVGALVTNFHLPRSTPLALVAAFAGLADVRRAYAEAVEAGYRFLSYGDAMLIT
ncbi:MAG: tRNA preQ1(34) S-adenosylmethionine ribosyltransferase-isomerase QueA [Candidatus Coatesbacteria bacterium]